ncbi:PhoR family transcriptional regulator [Nocardioides sp. Root190]|uniref:response regulator transcription factor n=1 Tax=Nocardioides sp. Root190 TaxID=1736488 RepID=UPI0006F6BF60|nr:response regulator transcription factor [Nocardioides sp. Root190]KRB73138.1 PhoR family transcriptional regulator [Nocardioides sp. Root190]
MLSVESPPSGPILVVEDERALAQIVADYLARAGFEAVQVHTGPDGVSTARDLNPDLVILDLGLPGQDGVEVCREIRTFSDCYVLMVTARDDEVDKLIGLGVGADDYLTKPFSPRELVARVQAALRRPRASKMVRAPSVDGLLLFDGLSVDVAAREVLLGSEPVALTRTEFDILVALAQKPRRAFSRRQLVDAVWGEDWVGDLHIVDVHIAHTRRKLQDEAAAPQFIDTVRGVGYRFIGGAPQ